MTTATMSVDAKARQVVANIRNLPTPPIVFHQIQKVLSDPNVSANQIASILSEDPAMAVKVLKLTNSAFYGLAREVESVKHAVVIVGLEAIKNLVLAASVLEMFKGDHLDHEYQDRFWRHSLAVASCGRLIARRLKSRGMVDPDGAFSAGLLHDIGKIVLASYLKPDFARLREARTNDKESPDYSIEFRVLGYDHTQIGEVLAEQWKLPRRLQTAIRYHHVPAESTDDDPIAYQIHIANYVAKNSFLDDEERGKAALLDPAAMSHMQIGEADIEEYKTLLQEEYLKAETFMQMAGAGSRRE